MTQAIETASQSNQPEIRAGEDQIERELLAEGVLDHVPPPTRDLTPYQNRKPIRVEGTPVSELLIAERR